MAVQVDSTTSGDVTIIALIGEIDGKSAPDAQAQVVAAIPEHGSVVLDMAGVEYMSSAGLRMMLLLYRQAVGKGTRVALAGLEEEIKDTMDATGFLEYFVVADDVPAAQAALEAE